MWRSDRLRGERRSGEIGAMIGGDDSGPGMGRFLTLAIAVIIIIFIQMIAIGSFGIMGLFTLLN
jgi:hypothetical protein